MRFEEALDGIGKVIWHGKVYDVGNRRHELAELWREGRFVRLVKISELKPYGRREGNRKSD